MEAAVETARFCQGPFCEPPWLEAVEPGPGKGGELELVVRLRTDAVTIRRCLPTGVNGLRMRVEVGGER